MNIMSLFSMVSSVFMPMMLAAGSEGLVGIGAGMVMGIGALGASIGIGMASSKAFEAAARQPEIFSKLQTMLLTSIVFIESIAIYSLVVGLLLIFTF